MESHEKVIREYGREASCGCERKDTKRDIIHAARNLQLLPYPLYRNGMISSEMKVVI